MKKYLLNKYINFNLFFIKVLVRLIVNWAKFLCNINGSRSLKDELIKIFSVYDAELNPVEFSQAFERIKIKYKYITKDQYKEISDVFKRRD